MRREANEEDQQRVAGRFLKRSGKKGN